MLADYLEQLRVALLKGDEEDAEQAYKMLEKLGMDRTTARMIVFD